MDRLQQFVLILRCKLGSSGWRWGPEIGNEVSDRHVDLMANGANDRNGRCEDGPCHSFFVEAPEIFERSAAAADDQDVRTNARGQPIEIADALGDLQFGANP